MIQDQVGSRNRFNGFSRPDTTFRLTSLLAVQLNRRPRETVKTVKT